MFHKLLNFINLFVVRDVTQPVHIFCDASDKFGFASVVVVCGGQLNYIRFPCQQNSALAELEGLQVSLELSKMYLMQGYRVQVRCDNRGIVESFTRALAGQESKAPIYKKMLTFVKEHGEIFRDKNLKVRWCRGHQYESLNEVADWLTRNENIDNIDRFNYFRDVKNWGDLEE